MTGSAGPRCAACAALCIPREVEPARACVPVRRATAPADVPRRIAAAAAPREPHGIAALSGAREPRRFVPAPGERPLPPDVAHAVASRDRRRSERGQSAVETVAFLPLLITVALAIGHVLAAGLAHELAGHAAEAGAIAALRGGEPRDAVAAALPEWSRERVQVRVRGHRVRVRLEPPAVIPGAADVLAATATADAGP
jgi:hypothetical protein